MYITLNNLYYNLQNLGGISFSGLTDTSDDIPGIGQYEDFHTIDWQRDIARDRMHHRYIVKKKQDSFLDLIKVSKSDHYVYDIDKYHLLISNIIFPYRLPMMHGPVGCVFY